MNRKFEVTWRTLRTIAHSPMVRARVSEAYIHFSLMYMTDHIFPVLPIKDMINEDGDPTTPFKLATGTKYSVSNLRVLFCPCVVQKYTAHAHKKGVKYASSSAKEFLWYLSWNSIASKMVYCIRTKYKEDNIFI